MWISLRTCRRDHEILSAPAPRARAAASRSRVASGLLKRRVTGVKIARVANQCSRHELINGATARASRDTVTIVGEPPSGIERQPVDNHRHLAQQRLEPHQRGHGVDLITGGQAFGERHVVDDSIGEAAGDFWGNRADAIAAHDVWVGFEDDVRVGSGGPGGLEQAGVGPHVYATELDRSVVLDLSGHQDDPSGARLEAELAMFADVVLRDLGGDHPLANFSCPRDLLSGELGSLEDFLEVRGAGGVVVDPRAVDDQRGRAGQVRPEADRSEKAVLHPPPRDPEPGGELGALVGLALAPGEQPRPPVEPGGLGVASGGAKADLGAGRGEERAGVVVLPPAKTEAVDPTAVAGKLAALQREVVDDVLGGAGVSRLRIDVAAVKEIGGREDLGDRSVAIAADHRRSAVVGEAPAGVERHAEAGDRQAAQERLETHLRADRVDRVDLVEQIDRGDRLGDSGDSDRSLEVPALFAGEDVGVGLDDDLGVGVLGPGGRDHLGEGRAIGEAALDREVAGRLVDHQHPPAALATERRRIDWRVVVLG